MASRSRLSIRSWTPRFPSCAWIMTARFSMDCSSPYAMAGLVRLKDHFRVAFANDPDADRHGIVTPSAGLMNPNHYLAVAIGYLLTHRPQWPAGVAIGKTLVSSSMIDRVVKKLGRTLCRLPSAPNGLPRDCSREPSGSAARKRQRQFYPPARWQGVDHRQGRSHHESARRRNHRRHRQGSG